METVRERILANLKTALERIQTANGYNYDFTPETVQRWSMHGNSLVNLPAIVISPGNEDEKPLADPYEECLLTVYLDVFFVSSPKGSVSTDTCLNRLQGDIKKAVLTDSTLGGVAVDTDVIGTTPFETTDGQPCAGLIIEIAVRYRHLRTDPAANY